LLPEDRRGPCSEGLSVLQPSRAAGKARNLWYGVFQEHIGIRKCRTTLLMTDINDLKITDYQALAEFRYRIRRFLRFSEKAARQAGLEPQHHQLMLVVKGAGKEAGPSIAYIAERLQLQHHSAVELVDRLVKRGLIKKSCGEADRREVQVKLTPRGERILTQLTLHHREELRTLAPALVSTLRTMMVRTHASYQVHKEEQARTDGTERRSSR